MTNETAPERIKQFGIDPDTFERIKKVAMKAWEKYGDDDPYDCDRIRKNGIWNDHIAVQAGVEVYREFYRAPSEPVAVTEALIDARDNGLIYWEPNTERGHQQKALMLGRIEAALANAPAAETVAVTWQDLWREWWRDKDPSRWLMKEGVASDAFEAGFKAALAQAQPAAVHSDDLAVDRFAAAMKAKLAKKRAEGRGGWNDPLEGMNQTLSDLLRGHVEKGDPLDVGNLAMMLHQRGERIAAQPAAEWRKPRLTDAMIRAACKGHFGDDSIDGIVVTVRDREWSFRHAFKRMWKGAMSALPPAQGGPK